MYGQGLGTVSVSLTTYCMEVNSSSFQYGYIDTISFFFFALLVGKANCFQTEAGS